VVDLAARAGVRRVTVLSSGSVTAGFDTDYQLPVEQAVEASGLEWTHLRPGEFAANRLALWGRRSGPSGWSAGPSRTRPATLSVREQVAAIAATIDADVRLEEVSRPEALRLLKEQGGWAAVNGPFLLGYEGFSAGEEYPEIAADELVPLPTVEQVTGRPARSFARWALDHAGDFR
jgi:uncharacterized protein YbjT (DUF2867 family)